MLEFLSNNGAIVERLDTARDLLTLLMTLAEYQHQVVTVRSR